MVFSLSCLTRHIAPRRTMPRLAPSRRFVFRFVLPRMVRYACLVLPRLASLRLAKCSYLFGLPRVTSRRVVCSWKRRPADLQGRA